MSIETSLAKFGKFLDKSFSKLNSTTKLLFSTKPQNIRKNGIQRGTQEKGNSPYLTLLCDSLIAFVSLFVSIHLRIGMDFLDYSPTYILVNMLVFVLIATAVFLWQQTYLSFWRYTSVEETAPLFISVVIANVIFFPLMMLMNQEDFLPYSVLIVNTFVLAILLLAPRFIARIVYLHKVVKSKRFDAITKMSERSMEIPEVLLIGNSSSVEAFFREVVENEDVSFNFNPVGILLINQHETGRVIKNAHILGELRDISRVVRVLNKAGKFPRQIVITSKSMPENARRFVSRFAKDNGIQLTHFTFYCSFAPIEE